eukprot:TRINITY_DN13826_c0_g1_i1.p1 TRINITY_DN13826_c0_g1~~TRINITY_DN13826_c0_g1_i1.p1  ORF type:complete len:492 (-),score=135.29 TRINITY_DN13826_c0_g1_i1:35-1510(-)
MPKNRIHDEEIHIPLEEIEKERIVERQDSGDGIPLEEEEKGENVKESLVTGESHMTNLKKNKLLTITYCANFLALGLSYGSVGPTLYAIAHNTNQHVEVAGSVFTGRGMGWLIGSASAGRIYEVANGNHTMATAAIIQVLIMVSLPFISNIYVMFVASAFQALFMSWIDVGCNALVMTIWKDKAGTWMQFLHFCFGVGASISPFIVGIFISSFEHGGAALWTYFPLSIGILIPVIPLFLLQSPKFQGEGGGEGGNEIFDQDADPATLKKQKIRYYSMIGLVAFYLFLYVGAESSYGGWITVYSKSIYGFDGGDEAFLTGLFWIAITVGRAIAIPMSMKCSEKTILATNMAGSMVCLIVLLACQSLLNPKILWGMTFLFGVSMGPIFATALSLPPSLNVLLTPRATSIVVVGASLGEMVMPMIVGFFMSSVSLLFQVLALFVPAIVIYFIVVFGLAPRTTTSKLIIDQHPSLVHNVKHKKLKQSDPAAEDNA